MRTLIIGNSGSGKTWLASRLAAAAGLTITHLDHLFWQDGGFHSPRPHAEQQGMAAAALSAPDWIVEGVFGQLAQSFLPHAQTLVWLDLPWPTCRDRLIQRIASGPHLHRMQDSDAAAALLAWAAEYDARSGSCSRAGHQGLFDAFSGEKTRLWSAEQTQAWLDARLAAY